MKLFLLSICCLFAFSSCMKEKDYNCKCTYVADASGPNSGQPNKEQSTVIKARIKDDAAIDCLGLEGKYITQFFSGSCLIQ